jgi:hypothetical protein
MKPKKYLVIEKDVLKMLIKDNALDRKNKDNTDDYNTFLDGLIQAFDIIKENCKPLKEIL